MECEHCFSVVANGQALRSHCYRSHRTARRSPASASDAELAASGLFRCEGCAVVAEIRYLAVHQQRCLRHGAGGPAPRSLGAASALGDSDSDIDIDSDSDSGRLHCGCGNFCYSSYDGARAARTTNSVIRQPFRKVIELSAVAGPIDSAVRSRDSARDTSTPIHTIHSSHVHQHHTPRTSTDFRPTHNRGTQGKPGIGVGVKPEINPGSGCE